MPIRFLFDCSESRSKNGEINFIHNSAQMIGAKKVMRPFGKYLTGVREYILLISSIQTIASVEENLMG